MPANRISANVAVIHVFHKAFVRVNAVHRNLFAIPNAFLDLDRNGYFDKLAIVFCEVRIEVVSCISDVVKLLVVLVYFLSYVFWYRFYFFNLHFIEPPVCFRISQIVLK